MEKITFNDGVRTSRAKVTIDGTDYIVTPATYSGTTPLSAYIMNLLQTNIENAIKQNADNIGGDVYDNTSTYAVGDLVTYQDQLYVCTTAVVTAEEFDNTKWTEISILEVIDNIQPLPVGGTQGQVLTKNSSQDGDAIWSDQTGGDIVFVGDEENVPEDTKLFIDSNELANLGSEVVNSLSGNEETKAPSVKAVKNELVNRAEILKSGQINTTNTTAECDFTSGGLYLVIVQGNANSSIIFDVLFVNGYTGEVSFSRIHNSNSFATITYTTNKVTITNTSYRNYYSVVKLA